MVIGVLALFTLFLAVTAIGYMCVRVPFVPTPPHIIEAMISLVPWKGNELVIDLGAGDGRVLEAVKKHYPKVTAIGCEIVPTVWLLGALRALIRRSGVQMHLQSMFRMDVSRADVVVLYVFPALMERLTQKFEQELRPGTFIICHTFGFKGYTPLREIRVPRLGSEVSVFLYQWKKSS